jgi:enoyl-CoA hydratase
MNTALFEARTFESLTLELNNSVAHLKFNCPNTLNTLTPTFWREFSQVVENIDSDGNVKVLVISSTGKHFSAGMDLSVFQGSMLPGTATALEREQLRRLVVALQRIFTRLEQCRIPVIAAVQGGCIGGAFDLVTACDMRFCTQNAFFTIHEINLAMMADLGTLQRLPGLLPEGIVRELAFTGDRLSAERAKSLGLVNEVFDSHEGLVEYVLQLAARITKHSPLALAGTKEALNYSRDHSVEESLSMAALWQSAMFDPAQIAEGGRAQATKSEPVFPALMSVKTSI